MKTTNTVELIGQLGDVPTITFDSQANAVCVFLIGTDQQNNGQSKDWHHTYAYDKDILDFAMKIKKGSNIKITGHLRTRNWSDDTGTLRRSNEIIVDTICEQEPA